jgi:hypothetical protein
MVLGVRTVMPANPCWVFVPKEQVKPLHLLEVAGCVETFWSAYIQTKVNKKHAESSLEEAIETLQVTFCQEVNDQTIWYYVTKSPIYNDGSFLQLDNPTGRGIWNDDTWSWHLK